MEVFRSIQGEGPYAGLPQVFVRFFECNMHCVWCDTPASIGDTTRKYKEVSLADLLKQVDDVYEGCHSVSITGGEPLVQIEFLKDFCRALKQSQKKIYLDSNGTLPEALKHIIKDVDIVAMDIKLPSSTKQRPFWREHKEFVQISRRKEIFIKMVISLETRAQDVLKAAKLIASIDPKILLILQPNYLDLRKGIMDQCVAYQKLCAKMCKDVRILPQVHKFLKIR